MICPVLCLTLICASVLVTAILPGFASDELSKGKRESRENNKLQQFPTHLHGNMRTVAGLLLVFAAAVPVAMVAYVVFGGHVVDMIIFAVSYLLVMGCIGATIPFTPRLITVDDHGVTVRFWMHTVHIPFSVIREVRVGDPVELRHSFRSCGVSGLASYYGNFSNKALGSYDAYLNRIDRFVVLRRNPGNHAIVISADDPEGLAASISEHIGTNT
jgi:hypothetical protein